MNDAETKPPKPEAHTDVAIAEVCCGKGDDPKKDADVREQKADEADHDDDGQDDISEITQGSIHGMRAESPNDPKLSDRGGRRGPCRSVERWWWFVAGAVTPVAVR